MADPIPTLPAITDIVPLTTRQWEDARLSAEKIIRARLAKPQRAQFMVRESERPPLLTAITMILLSVVALAAFYLSAGKEIVAVDPILTSMANQSTRLSPAYASGGILATLLLSEVGVILFGLAGHERADKVTVARILRAFQLLCMAVALSANITTTMQHPITGSLIFDWLLTLIPPSIVIGVGLVLEQSANDWIVARGVALRSYLIALDGYQKGIDTPDQHPEWFTVWGEAILDKLVKKSQRNAEIIGKLIEDDPHTRQGIVKREYDRHQWKFDATLIPVSAIVSIPSQPETHEMIETPETAQPVSPSQRDQALEMLKRHPEMKAVSLTDLETQTGISRATWQRAKKAFSANGHTKEVVPS